MIVNGRGLRPIIRYRKKFCWFPTTCYECHQKTGETVWLAWVEIIEYGCYMKGLDGQSCEWNGYVIRPYGKLTPNWEMAKKNILGMESVIHLVDKLIAKS